MLSTKCTNSAYKFPHFCLAGNHPGILKVTQSDTSRDLYSTRVIYCQGNLLPSVNKSHGLHNQPAYYVMS